MGLIGLYDISNNQPDPPNLDNPVYLAEKDPDATLEVSDLESWEANHGRIPDHSVVLLSSGWDLKWPDANAVFGTNVSANISQDVRYQVHTKIF